MSKMFELTNETMVFCSRTLHRIRALADFGTVKRADFGGFVEKEDNLSQSGDAEVSGHAWVSGSAKVSKGAEEFTGKLLSLAFSSVMAACTPK